MIIGEKNLIIGKIFSIISDSSISLFFYIKKQINYTMTQYKKYIIEIIPRKTSPPSLIYN